MEATMANFEFVLPPPPTKQVKPLYGEQDLIRRSASNVPPPARQLTEVAKLIDVSKCIGCKACQSACLSGTTSASGRENVGVYDNPPDLTRICLPSCASRKG
jgi:formate dehydrogenase iron-sulfur subunit